ncbi:MAG: hypothetical protein JWM03_462 [Rhodocyclales bacterium]|nr:hypothetical protein [Rhodocyclales bacterium]
MSAHTSVLCAIPGLIWPASGLPEALNGLALPGLSALLAHADVRHAVPYSLDAWLAAQFGLANNAPFAAIRLAGEEDEAPATDTSWVCADPVGLRFARQHLLLDGPAALDLQAHEMTSLFDDLDKTFADVGKFRFTSLHHGYIALDAAHADKLAVTLAPLCDVEDRPVAHFQPQGAQAAWWSHLANELQVFCHNHPVNKAREARGAAPLNALWLWGAGCSPSGLTPPAARLAAHRVDSSPLLSGLVRLAQTTIEAFEPTHAAGWILLDALHEPAKQRDMARWSQALQMLDTAVFMPLSQQIRTRKITRLALVSPGDTTLASFDIGPTPRWKIWRRHVSKDRLLAALGSPT